jgi:hypothetical protein
MLEKFADAKSVVFVHIPKTAGTSFTQYLKNGLLGAADGPIPDRRITKELFCGHEYLRLSHSRINHAYFVTFLRDPIDRTISQYRSLRNPSNYEPNWRDQISKVQVAALEFCQSATFREFINSHDKAVLGHIVNPQTRMLSDHRVADEDLMDRSIPKRHVLSSACKNLVKKINFLGIYEMIDTSLMMFEKETGVNGTLSHLNRSETFDVNLTSNDLARLCDLLDMDFQLYDFGLRVFASRIGSLERSICRQ